MAIRRPGPPAATPIVRDDTPLATTPWIGFFQGLHDQANTIAGLAASADYADDVAAAAGGVEIGGIYRTANVVKVRIA